MKVVVTGAFSYSGRYIAQRLLDAGHTVITLTHRPAGTPLRERGWLFARCKQKRRDRWTP